ncbi:MAG TPA: flagellin lysine-N-methylase [Selenomonadales bacterium]|nr:flagellin lysine-N-methylase [Selenomonadales bacterium]
MSVLLQPQYAGRFRCIGPDCEDTCCHYWKIAIDKKTYQRYRSCPDPGFRAKLDKYVVRNRSTPTDNNYAKIKLDESGYCPFLDNERLCSIQRNWGKDYLSEICATYPRTFFRVDDAWEMAIQLSCPAAARLALLDPNPMEFEYVANPYSLSTKKYREFKSAVPDQKNKNKRYFWPIRIFVISLLQNRSYLLWQRMVILGFFMNAIENIDNPEEIPSVIEKYDNRVAGGAFQGALDEIPAQDDVQLGLLLQLFQYRFTTAVTPKFLECSKKFTEVIAPEEELKDEVVAQRFKEAFEHYYIPFMNDHEYILENYLVHQVFKSKLQLFSDYVLLVLNYAIVKLLLVGIAGYYKETFSTDHAIELIYSFSRNIEHNVQYLDEIYRMFEENELNTLPYMAILLRN